MQTTKPGQGKSSYQRHGKTPFVYSSEYQEWRAAINSRDEHRIRRANEAWRHRFEF